MRVYDLHDQEGRVFAFEVNNFLLIRADIVSIARKIPGVRIVRHPRRLSWLREEIFCEFELDGIVFEAWEPFGDNSRYWIGPEPARWVPQIEAVRQAFLAA